MSVLLYWLPFAFFHSFAEAFRLYPEQDGKYDWHRAHVGAYTGVAICDSFYSQESPGSLEKQTPDSFMVATDDGVLARIIVADGELVWRQVLEDGMHVDGAGLTCADGAAWIGGGEGEMHDVFDAVDGRWVGSGVSEGRPEGQQDDRTRVCLTEDNCVDVIVAPGAKPVTKEELAACVSSASLTRPVTVVVAFSDDVVVQCACGTSAGFDRTTRTPRWRRFEYLSSIDHTLFTDLPPSTPALEDAWKQTQPSTSRALFVQLLILKSQLGMGTPRDAAIIESYKTATSDLLRPTRDMEGFRQQIVVTSARSGKVASLHSGDGRMLWEVDVGVGSESVFNNLDNLDDLVVVPWSVSDRESVLAIFAVGKGSTAVRVVLIDGFTGQVLGEERIAGSTALSVVPVGSYEREATQTTQHAFAVLEGQEGKAAVLAMLPKEAAAEASVTSAMDMLVQWRVSADRKYVYGIKPKAGEVWRVNVASEASETSSILEVAVRDTDEAMYSVAKPVFGGGVLIKSVNANALLVIAGDGEREALDVTVVDAVTGRVIVSQEVRNARAPVKGIVSENWVAYHYWNTLQSRWTIGVIDLYHPQPNDLTVASLLTGTYEGVGKNNTSPYDTPETLLVESERYRVKYPASCLAVTKTAHGTAAKMLLLGTPSGQIAAIDRRMLDPRRPNVKRGAKPTPEQAFEGLPAFHPELNVAGPSFVTLYHRVERLRDITTTAAVLESSSLVFANGLDSFFMRMMPSRGFDTVPPDFPRALLVTMVLGLGVALSLLRRVVRSRTLGLSWS